MPFLTEPIAALDASSGFSCGVHHLDDFFRRHAYKNHVDGMGRTYVFRGNPPPPPVVGFYTISMSSLESAEAAKVIKERLPKYPCPAALLGRLAVHETSHGQGHGTRLLVDAIERILELSAEIGCRGIIADAKDEPAMKLYAKYGFTALTDEGWPRRMFVPTETVRAALPSVAGGP